VDYESGATGGLGRGGGGYGVYWGPSAPGRPGYRSEGSGVSQSVSGSGDIGWFWLAEGGGGGSGGTVGGTGDWGGTCSYGTQVCWYSFLICHPSVMIIGGTVHRE
jgi:hypothetical protein